MHGQIKELLLQEHVGNDAFLYTIIQKILYGLTLLFDSMQNPNGLI